MRFLAKGNVPETQQYPLNHIIWKTVTFVREKNQRTHEQFASNNDLNYTVVN